MSNDDPDTPHDPTLAGLGKPRRLRDGNGMYSRGLQGMAATRRLRARQLRENGDTAGAARQDHDAAYLERHAAYNRDPQQVMGTPLATGLGGEVVGANDSFDPDHKLIMQPPDMLAAEATEKRLLLTGKISDTALTLGLEISESIGARDGLERNLAHQMAAAHEVGMTMLAKAHALTAMVNWQYREEQQTELQVRCAEAARMATAAARVLDMSQRAALTLERLRNGGRQTVTVQHVTVRDGGQAVVAGRVDRGDGRA